MLKLKKIEVFGFKSFCDKQQLQFPGSGIASIVGPNGCGKSNVSDAISWVLGEQSAKSLRGARMQDVIFNGSRDRKPSGMATVSMTMVDPEASRRPSNGNGNGAGHGGLPSGEFTVTRKLFRSGESHYMLNGKDVLLRDIQNLFMGTGLGPNHYAIIEQGRIGQVLSSKPLDRRSIIEEAAGVTKFKSKKRLAELKLESAKQNLHRVHDILQEVTRQAASLKRQAGKAARYAEYRGQLTEALTALLASRQRRMAAEIRSSRESMTEAENAYRALAEKAEGLEQELSAKREQQQKSDAELQTGREELSRLAVEIERFKSRLEQQTRTVEDNAARKRHAEAEIVSIDQRLEQLDSELTAERAAAEKIGGQSAAVQQQLAEKNEEINRRRAEIAEREREQETSRKRMMSLLDEASALRNQLVKIEEFLAGNERQVARASEEAEQTRRELEQFEKQRAELRGRTEAKHKELDAAREHAAAIDKEIADLRDEAKRRRTRADELQQGLSRLRARRESLEEILSHHAYTTEAVKNLFSAIDRGDVASFKPIGILADIIEVDPKYEKAAEDFLREELEFIVVEGWDDARAGIQLLRTDLEGHATFLVHPQKPVPSEPPALGPETGVVGRLADFIHLQNGLSESASTILPKLRSCYLVEDEEAARALAVRYPDLYFLLPNGVCYRGYTVSGGRKSKAGPLALKRELRELVPSLADAERGFDENRKAAEDADERIAAKTAEQETLRAKLRGLETEAVGLDHELKGLDEQASRAERRAAVAKQEIDRLQQEAGRAREEVSKRKESIAQRERERSAAEEALEAIRGLLEAAQGDIGSLAEEQTKLRTEAAALDERRRAAAASLARVEHMLGEQRQRRERILEQVAEWDAERERLAADNETLAETIKETGERKTGLESRVAELAALLNELREGVGEVEDSLKQLRLQVEEARQRRSQAELKLVQLESDLKHLAEMCENELKRPLEEVAAEAPEELTPEHLAEAEERYHDLKTKIERLGPVNVLALEEYEEASQRQEFLETQEKDLLKSIEDTQKAIHEIDSESKRQFVEAFEAINANFKHVFATLFGGGTGEMRLTDPENPGESGIDIVASPPGKRLQNVLLLSGGEKSLTALALLMATFKYKPSPFCVLDEVDAALDEPNIMRFRRLLEEMMDRTQFVVITHSKSTMQSAQSLYGVTMQEPGVSKIVSVRIGDHADGVNGRSAARREEAVPVGA